MGTKVLIDTNILIYAFIKNSPFYLKCREILEKLAEDEKIEVCVAEKSIFEMIAVLSSAALTPQKLNSREIEDYIFYFIQSESFNILYSNQQTTNTTLKLFFNLEARKNRVYDLVLAAIAIEHDIDTIYTKNVKDFESIKGIKVIDPTISL